MEEKWEKEEAKKKTILIFVAFSIFVLFSVLLFSVDIGSLYEVSQNSEYFYASEAIGLSMYPEVYTGDVLVIQETSHPDFDVKIGDILIFNYKQYTVGHRVLEIHPRYYVTKGDNNYGYEEVYPSQVVGRVYKTVYRNNPIEKYVFWVVAN